MADEARLVFELVDRSGPAAAAINPQVPGGAEIPGASVADFHKHVTAEGAGASAGKGSIAAPSLEVQPAIPPQSLPTSQDALLNTVRQLLASDPKVTISEIQAALGIPSGRAENLLKMAAQGRDSSVPIGEGVAGEGGIPKPPPLSREQILSQANFRQPPLPETPPLFPEPPPLSREQQRERTLRDAADNPPPIINKVLDEGREEVTVNKQQAQHAVQSIVGNLGGIASQLGVPGMGIVGPALQQVSPQLGAAAAAAPSIAAALGPAALVAGTAAISVMGARSLINAAMDEGERATAIVGNLSPEAAQSRAEASVRQTMADLRTAARLGDEVGDFIEAKSRISTSLQGLRDIAAEPILKDLNNIMGTLAGTLDGLNTFLQQNPKAQQFVQERVAKGADTFLFGPILGPLLGPKYRKLFEDMNTALKRQESMNNPFSWFGAQQHLEPPEPFAASDRTPMAFMVEPMAGLSF